MEVSLLFCRLKYLRIKLTLRIFIVLNYFMATVESENEKVENILRFENILRLKNVLWRWGLENKCHLYSLSKGKHQDHYMVSTPQLRQLDQNGIFSRTVG